MKQDTIVILDLGSHESARIARLIRKLGVYSEIHPHDITAEQLRNSGNIKGIILNGGENRIVDGAEVDVREEIYSLGLPVLAVDHAPARTENRLAAWPESADSHRELGLRRTAPGPVRR